MSDYEDWNGLNWKLRIK